MASIVISIPEVVAKQLTKLNSLKTADSLPVKLEKSLVSVTRVEGVDKRTGNGQGREILRYYGPADVSVLVDDSKAKISETDLVKLFATSFNKLESIILALPQIKISPKDSIFARQASKLAKPLKSVTLKKAKRLKGKKKARK